MDQFRLRKTKQTLSKSFSKTITNENGDVVENSIENIFKVVKVSEPAYVKHYIQDLDFIYSLPKGTIRVLSALFPLVVFNKNTFNLNASLKRQICKKLDIKFASLDNSLSNLCKNRFILRIDTGFYLLNPYYFGKGDWQQMKLIRDKIKISDTGNGTFDFKINPVEFQ
ncbi:replication/maintenance protein RepL [Shewanella vesiculosa]|uniref:Replication/maintenance protein RepL n=1 Tax=Shewanella vesiculosa TaxID=518738 RepID=A0ABV0FN96_9GAMM